MKKKTLLAITILLFCAGQIVLAEENWRKGSREPEQFSRAKQDKKISIGQQMDHCIKGLKEACAENDQKKIGLLISRLEQLREQQRQAGKKRLEKRNREGSKDKFQEDGQGGFKRRYIESGFYGRGRDLQFGRRRYGDIGRSYTDSCPFAGRQWRQRRGYMNSDFSYDDYGHRGRKGGGYRERGFRNSRRYDQRDYPKYRYEKRDEWDW